MWSFSVLGLDLVVAKRAFVSQTRPWWTPTYGPTTSTYSSRHSQNSKKRRAGPCLQTDHAGHCSLVIAWYLYWDIAIVAVASSFRTSWAWLAVLYENEHPLINSCWKKVRRCDFHREGYGLNELPQADLNMVIQWFELSILCLFFGNVLSKIQFEARFREICKGDLCSLSLCFLSLQFLKRPEISFWNKKFPKGKKKMARAPPFFWFFCTKMHLYGNV